MTTTVELIRAEAEARECQFRVKVLVEQLTLKFGPIPPETREAIYHASPEQLRTLITRMDTATTLADVLS